MRRVLPLAVLTLALPAAGQDGPAPQLVFPVGLDVVNLAITVHDGRGHLVSDLGPDDFVVLEDGRPQRVRLFARAVEPGHDEALALDLGLLMDTSESMIKEMRLSKEAAVRFLESVPRARDLVTIFFDQDIRISRFDSENQQGLFARIHESKGGGMTALYDAIAVYLSRVQDSPGRKVLVLFSDGEDSTSEITLGEIRRLVRSTNVTIYPVAFTGGFPTGSARAAPALAFLREIAEVTGGEVFRPSASRELAEVYDRILQSLSSQYVLGYTPDVVRRDGRFRKVKVEVRRRGVKVRHRQGYYAPDA